MAKMEGTAGSPIKIRMDDTNVKESTLEEPKSSRISPMKSKERSSESL